MNSWPWSRRADSPGVGEPARRQPRVRGPWEAGGGHDPVLEGLGEAALQQSGEVGGSSRVASLEDAGIRHESFDDAGDEHEDLKGAGARPKSLGDAGGVGRGWRAAGPSGQ